MATQRTSTRITTTLRIDKDELESIIKAHYGLQSSTVDWDIALGTVESMVIETTSTSYSDADVVL